MIYSCLATVVALFGAAHGQGNIALDGGNKCSNYIQVYSNLYPVNRCYQENNDPDQVCQGDSSCLYDQSMMYQCRTSAGGNGTEACLVRMGTSCSSLVYDEQDCVPCNGVDDACECTVGGNPDDDCDYYERTDYDEDYAFGQGWYCNKKESIITRSVVNMCIQGKDTYDSTLGYRCGGVDPRTGTIKDYARDVKTYSFTNEDCSGDVTYAPTAQTLAPSPAPTPAEEDTDTDAYGTYYCSEYTCNGLDSPRADGVDRMSVVVAIAFAVFASLIA